MDQERHDKSGHIPDDADEFRQGLEWAKAEFDRQAAEDAANGVVRKWDGTNGLTTAEAIAYLDRLGREAQAGR